MILTYVNRVESYRTYSPSFRGWLNSCVTIRFLMSTSLQYIDRLAGVQIHVTAAFHASQICLSFFIDIVLQPVVVPFVGQHNVIIFGKQCRHVTLAPIQSRYLANRARVGSTYSSASKSTRELIRPVSPHLFVNLIIDSS